MPGYRELAGLSEESTETTADGEGATATVSVRTEERHLNVLGGVHGGLLATMVDTAMANAVRAALGEGRRGVTVSLTITYLEAAREGDELVATAQVRRAGGRIVIAEADVLRRGDDVDVAHGVGTFTPMAERSD